MIPFSLGMEVLQLRRFRPLAIGLIVLLLQLARAHGVLCVLYEQTTEAYAAGSRGVRRTFRSTALVDALPSALPSLGSLRKVSAKSISLSSAAPWYSGSPIISPLTSSLTPLPAQRAPDRSRDRNGHASSLLLTGAGAGADSLRPDGSCNHL